MQAQIAQLPLRARVRPFRTACMFAVLMFIGIMPILSQVATGDILGTVMDASGSSVPGASVRLENTGTHEVRTFVTKNSGEYTFSAVQPGTYSITVASPSFKSYNAKGVVVSAADRVRIDATLQPGTVDQQIVVEATPSSLQTDSTTVGSTITEKRFSMPPSTDATTSL